MVVVRPAWERIMESDSRSQMNVTNSAAIVYNPAHHAKPRNAVSRSRPDRHDYAEPARQIKRLDRRDGARSPFSDGRGGQRRQRSRDHFDRSWARILRG